MAIRATRNMLRYEYSWQASGGDDPLKTRIDARLLNRNEGYEVLRMINRVAKHFGYESASDVEKTENLIKTELPGNVRGRKNVLNWLVSQLQDGVEPDGDDAVEEMYERIARYMVGCYESTGSIPRQIDEELGGGHWSDNPTVEASVASFERDEQEDPPVGTYEGRVKFDSAGQPVTFSLDFSYSGEDLRGSTSMGDAD